MEKVVGGTVVAPVKSKFASKTNITAALLALLGLATAFKVLPPELADPEVVGGLVAAGATLVGIFRTIANSVVK